jgi:aminomethyltransferase
VVRFSDGFLITTEAITYARVLETLNRFTLAGDFHVTDLTNETAMLSLQGREALALGQTVFGEIVTTIGPNGAIQKDAAKIIRASHTAEDGLDLLVGSDDAVPLWEALVGAGARPVGHDALEVLRIEAGVPRYGVDVDETTVVPEAGLDDAVSYTKGCYIGQEIIARIKYRGHVAKKLTGVVFEGRANVEPGARIRSIDDREIGRLTSVAFSPRLARTIALGYVKYDSLAGGTAVKVASRESEFQAEVHELPFVRGRWGQSDE